LQLLAACSTVLKLAIGAVHACIVDSADLYSEIITTNSSSSSNSNSSSSSSVLQPHVSVSEQ
jgi:hypothetical protein